jgi:hypothetical protein
MRSRRCPYVCVCASSITLLGNGSVKVALSLLGNGYFFHVVRIVSKESRLLVLHRISCFFNVPEVEISFKHGLLFYISLYSFMFDSATVTLPQKEVNTIARDQ